MDVREYQTPEGDSPFGSWFEDLDAQAAAKVAIAVVRIGRGPGYRIYFGKDGDTLVILLAG